MYIYLVAQSGKNYDSSAYCAQVGNFNYMMDRRLGWTVVEAYLNGLLDVSRFIIKKGLYESVNGFVLCTSSGMVVRILDTNYLGELYEKGWKSEPNNPLFHVPLLQELYYHWIFYKERGVKWQSMTEVDELELRHYELCKSALEKYLLEVDK